MKPVPYNTKWYRYMRAIWKKRGLCIDCGALAKPGRVRCTIHLAADRKRHLSMNCSDTQTHTKKERRGQVDYT